MELLRYNYKQKNDWTCGPAVARTVLHSFGIYRDIRAMTRELRTTRAGTANSDFVRLLRRYQMRHTVKTRATLRDIARILKTGHRIVVAYWIPRHQESHYSIVKAINRKRIYFHDTWYGGNHSYSLAYFLKNWHDDESVRLLIAIKR